VLSTPELPPDYGKRGTIRFVLTGSPNLLSAVSVSIKNQNSRSLERAAHALKSKLSIFVAPACMDRVLHLESMARKSDFAAAEELWKPLEKEMEDLQSVWVNKSRNTSAPVRT
jgi:HPt (histidine-containing phosphotransfer) domain-containing protein